MIQLKGSKDFYCLIVFLDVLNGDSSFHTAQGEPGRSLVFVSEDWDTSEQDNKNFLKIDALNTKSYASEHQNTLLNYQIILLNHQMTQFWRIKWHLMENRYNTQSKVVKYFIVFTVSTQWIFFFRETKVLWAFFPLFQKKINQNNNRHIPLAPSLDFSCSNLN